MTTTNGMNTLKKSKHCTPEIEDCIVGSKKRQKTKTLGQKEGKRQSFGSTEMNSKMYIGFSVIRILQKG